MFVKTIEFRGWLGQLGGGIGLAKALGAKPLRSALRPCAAVAGRGALKQFLLGGVTQQVLARSSIPVRVFR